MKKKKKTRYVRNRNLFNFLIGRNRNLDNTNWKKNTRKMNYEKRKHQFLLLFYFIFVFLLFLSYQTQHFQFNSNQIKQTMVFIKCQNTTSITTPTSPSPNSHPIPPLLPSVGILGFGMDFRLGLTVSNLLLD